MPSVDTATGSTRRNAGSAYLIYRVARAQGAPSEVLLSGCGGLDEATMSRPEGVLTAAQELRLIENMLAAVHNPAIGVDIGRRHTPGSFGLLGFGLLSSPTVLSAIELSVTFRPLTNVFALPLARFEQGHLVATLPSVDVPVRTAHFLADLWVATLAALLRALAPGHPIFRGVTLPRPRPANEKPWNTALGVRPRFGSTETTVVIDRDTLAHRLPTADPQARSYCEQRLRRTAQPLRRQARRGGRGTRAIARPPRPAPHAARSSPRTRCVRADLAPAAHRRRSVLPAAARRCPAHPGRGHDRRSPRADSRADLHSTGLRPPRQFHPRLPALDRSTALGSPCHLPRGSDPLPPWPV